MKVGPKRPHSDGDENKIQSQTVGKKVCYLLIGGTNCDYNRIVGYMVLIQYVCVILVFQLEIDLHFIFEIARREFMNLKKFITRGSLLY